MRVLARKRVRWAALIAIAVALWVGVLFGWNLTG